MATPLNFTINDTPYWNNYVVGYQNQPDAYIGSMLFPRAKVPGRLFKYRVYDMQNSFTVPKGMQISTMGKFAKKEQKFSEKTDSVLDYGVYSEIANQDIYDARELNQIQWDLKQEAINDLIITQDNRYEMDAASAAQTASNYATGHKITLTTNGSGAPYWWSDATNSDPVKEINIRKLTYVGIPYNAFWCSELVWHYISKHPKVISWCKGNTTSDGRITKELFGQEMGFEYVLVGKHKYNSAAQRKTVDLDPTWTSYAGMAVINKTVPYYGGQTFGYTAWYNPESPTSSPNSRRNVYQNVLDRIENGNHGGIQIGVGCQEKINITAPELGFLWTSAIDPTSNPQNE